MAISKLPLGMNARNFQYIQRYNKAKAKHLADDKLETKKRLLEHGKVAPALLGAFENRSDAREFGWGSLPETFVIKPARGYGGNGIMIVEHWNGAEGKDLHGDRITVQDMESHIFDILEGVYSLQLFPDRAFIEERLFPQSFFKKTAAIGMPDVRVIVFNGVPVMAMLRVPTKESGGKANLHQGALGIGIDIATGVTTTAIQKNKKLRFFPDTKTKPHGLKIPAWYDLLLLAVTAQKAIGLGYAGVDIVIDAKRGPMVLEINARPGLSIQNANGDSLRTRLERVAYLETPTLERGIDIAQSLFAEPFSNKVTSDDKPVLGIIEPVIIKHAKGEYPTRAKIDSGAYRTSIDKRLARRLDLQPTGNTIAVHSATGSTKRTTVEIVLILRDKTIVTEASVIDRARLRFPMIIGRKDIRDFLIDPSRTEYEAEEPVAL